MSNEEKQNSEQTSEQLDVVWLFKYLFDYRRLIIKWIVGAIALCFVVSLLKSNVYTAEATIVPISNANTSANSGLMGLANSMVGFDISSIMGRSSQPNVIPPAMYEKVIASDIFLLELGDVEVDMGEKGKMSLYESIVNDTIASFTDNIIKYTIGLPSTIKAALSSDDDDADELPFQLDTCKYRKLDKTQQILVNKLKGMISIEMDDQLKCYYLKTNAPSPEMAADITSAAVEILSDMVGEYNCQLTAKRLEVAERQMEGIKTEFEEARSKFFKYRDTHHFVREERVSAEFQKLSDDYDMAHALLKSSASSVASIQLELSTLKQPFVLLAPVTMPTQKSGPSKFWHIVGGFLLGFIVIIAYLLLRLAVDQVFHPEKFEAIYAKYRCDQKENTAQVNEVNHD